MQAWHAGMVRSPQRWQSAHSRVRAAGVKLALRGEDVAFRWKKEGAEAQDWEGDVPARFGFVQ
jgi:hypothetical protein